MNNKMRYQLNNRTLFGSFISLCITSASFATIWTVDDDGKADFNTIQAAIDIAVDGDEIIVMPGTYTSSQDGLVVNMLGKAIVLRSSDPTDPAIVASTIIDGKGINRGIVCSDAETNFTIIDGITFFNCKTAKFVGGEPPSNNPIEEGVVMFGLGAGLYCGNGTSPTIRNCVFLDNTALWGGGVGIASYSNPTITNCTFRNNTAYLSGGGLVALHYSNPTITNCTFIENVADFGGGMSGAGWDPLEITNCSFVDNTAVSLGGGVIFTPATILTDTKICGNTPDQTLGEYIDGGGNTITYICTPSCPDINSDGFVNVTDLLAVVDQWGQSNSPADFNGDGTVNVTDILIVIDQWGACQ